MNIKLFIFFALLSAALSPLVSSAQNEPIIVEAESGSGGSDFSNLTQVGVTYISTTTNGGGSSPGTTARVRTYTVTFPSAGTYALYIRVRVGSGTFNDDSLFYGNGFGAKSETNGNDWVTVNGLAPVGFTAATDLVSSAGTAASGVWKWLKLSDFNGGTTPVTFTVPGGALTQTFQLGAREDGLDIDKFAFGPSTVFYTVSNLDTATAGTTIPPPPPFTPTSAPLATGKTKFLGSVSSPTQVVNFTHYFNQVIPENGGKWGSVEGTRGTFNWGDLDNAYNLAKTNGYPFTFHVLIWGSQQPTWIETLSPADQLTEIQNWYQAVAARYPGIDVLQVVNEPLHTPPDTTGGGGNYINALGGSGTTGWDWVLNAFRLARLYFPRTKLIINEYSVTNDTNAANQYIHIIQLLQAEGLIDGIGIQGHAFETRVSADTLRSNLDLIAGNTALPIYVTEFDIDGPTDDIQLADYQRIFPVFWEHPAVRGITLWGYRPGMWRTAQGAMLALDNGAEKSALLWLKSYVPVGKPPQLRSYINGAVTNLTLRLGATETILSQAADLDGDMFQHWLEIQNPDGVWSWQGWLTTEPWAGALAGDGGRSQKSGTFTFNQAGVWTVRSSAIDGSGQWQISPELKVSVGLTARPTVTVTVNGGASDLTVSIGTTVSVSGHAVDSDGDMAEHWLEIQNPAGQWSWEGWLTSEPWAGALGGTGGDSTKTATFTFTQAGTYLIRSTATDSTDQWSLSSTIAVHVQ